MVRTPTRIPSFAVQLREAMSRSFIGRLPDRAVEQLTVDAVRLDIPAGATFYRDADEARAGIVVSGLIRVFMTSPEGRQVTVRYARPADVLGVAVTVGGPASVSVQAITDSTVGMLNVRTLERLGRSDPAVAWAIAEELNHRLYDTLDELAGNAFLTLRGRVARHLLDLAAQRQSGHRLVAPVTQQELADAVASVREVVTRVLGQLRDEGLIETGRDEIVVLEPGRLAEEAERPPDR